MFSLKDIIILLLAILEEVKVPVYTASADYYMQEPTCMVHRVHPLLKVAPHSQHAYM